MTAEESARLGAFTSQLAQSLNNGFGQITSTGKMVSDVATNPFMKKKTEGNV